MADASRLDTASDQAVVQQAASTEVTRLVNEHAKSLYAYAFRLTGSSNDAEDLTQQVFLIAQQKIGQLRDPNKARAWLFRILRNEFLASRQRKAPVSEADLECDIASTKGDETQESQVDRERLQASLNELSDEYRVILVMFYFDELSYKEIAAQLEIPIGTVMSRLARAKSSLRSKLGAANAV